MATTPYQVWCWDMTYLPTQVHGRWFYLYLIQDLYSRKIVGCEIHDANDADHAVSLRKRTALAEGIHAMTDTPVLHGDNGSTLKATTVLAMLRWLGVKPPYSSPRVPDANAFVKTLFTTAKYRPDFPVRSFATLEVARLWGRNFVRWYNFEHRHSGIRNVTPAQRHALEDWAIPDARHQTYLQARERILRATPVGHATGQRPARSRSIQSAPRSCPITYMLKGTSNNPSFSVNPTAQ